MCDANKCFVIFIVSRQSQITVYNSRLHGCLAVMQLPPWNHCAEMLQIQIPHRTIICVALCRLILFIKFSQVPSQNAAWSHPEGAPIFPGVPVPVTLLEDVVVGGQEGWWWAPISFISAGNETDGSCCNYVQLCGAGRRI